MIVEWLPAFRFVGHRGGRGPGWPVENTLAAFDEARRRGAVAIEFDVRTSRDGEPMVIHDPTVSRVAGIGRHVHDLSRRELEALRLADGSSRVPALEEVVAWANSHGVALNCELKHDVPSRVGLAHAAATCLEACRVPLLVSSFDPVSLALFARQAPRVPRALLTELRQGLAGELFRRVARPPLVDVLHPEYADVDESFLARAKGAGLRVGAWTVNVPARARALLSMGVDYVITDDVGLMGERAEAGG